jgi:putative membrane protein (TIGR04086 family)
MIKTQENTNNENNNLKNILKGSAIAIILTLLMIAIFSILLTYTKIQENIIPTVTIVISAISILIGGSLTTAKIKKNGMITGGLVGLIYILAIYLISSITTKNFSLNNYSIIMIIASILAGGLGGIMGVNFKNKF